MRCEIYACVDCSVDDVDAMHGAITLPDAERNVPASQHDGQGCTIH